MRQDSPQTPYSGFTGQFINGQWIDGRAVGALQVTNPYDDGKRLVNPL